MFGGYALHHGVEGGSSGQVRRPRCESGRSVGVRPGDASGSGARTEGARGDPRDARQARPAGGAISARSAPTTLSQEEVSGVGVGPGEASNAEQIVLLYRSVVVDDMPVRALSLLLLASCGQLGHGFQEAHEISTRNFDKVKQGMWLLKFYAPWCGHCKKMAPVFEEVAEHFHRQDGSHVSVGRIDGTAHPGLTEPFNVKGYPTLLLLRDGDVLAEFKGPRTFKAITEFVESASSGELPHAPSAPRSPTPTRDGRAARGSLRDALMSRFLRWGRSFADLDPLDAGLLVLATFVAIGAGFVLLLCATTSASTRR